MVRVKICGITRVADALAAAEAGADAIGLVFATSPRRVNIPRAKEIVAAMPPWVATVGVFVNAAPAALLRTAAAVGLTDIQLHGDESPAYLRRLRFPRIIKAIRVRDASFVEELARIRDAGASGILLDAFVPGLRGGSGKPFNWQLVKNARSSGKLADAPPLILAGGLTPRTAREAISLVRPWGVDVSGGVELSPGIKSPALISRFIKAVRSK